MGRGRKHAKLARRTRSACWEAIALEPYSPTASRHHVLVDREADAVDPAPLPEGVVWGLVRITPTLIHWASAAMVRAGLFPFAPTSRREYVLAGVTRTAEGPVLPGYVFVGRMAGTLFPHWEPGEHGIIGVVRGISQEPVRVSAEAVQRIDAHWRAGRWDDTGAGRRRWAAWRAHTEPKPEPMGYMAGDRVRIVVMDGIERQAVVIVEQRGTVLCTLEDASGIATLSVPLDAVKRLA